MIPFYLISLSYDGDRMKKVLLGLCLVLSLLMSFSAFAEQYNDMTESQLVELYKQSCEQEQFANCYQLGMIYKKYPDTVIEKNDDPKLNKTGAVLAKENLSKACSGGETAACKELKGQQNYEGAWILYYAALGLIGLAVFLIAKTIFQDEDQFQAQEKLEDSKAQSDDIAKHGIILRYSRPFFKRYFSPIVSGMKNKKKFKEQYRRKLAAAGLTNVLTPEDFFAFKLFLIIGFPILFMVIRAFLEETWPLQLIPILAFIGFFYPDFWIKGKIEGRQKEIIRAMPFGVDMLALSVEAGLDFIAAMAKVIEKAKPTALTEEFEILIREIRIGASRAEALRNLAWRVDLIQISSFAATLIAADSVGASIGPILKSLAVEIRQKKSAEVEKAGATAATKILFPMMFLIIPSVLIIVFAPIILEFIGGK
jgi:tight adherence protein C